MASMHHLLLEAMSGSEIFVLLYVISEKLTGAKIHRKCLPEEHLLLLVAIS